MEKPSPHRWTFDEFLAVEAEETERCELVDGVVHIIARLSLEAIYQDSGR